MRSRRAGSWRRLPVFSLAVLYAQRQLYLLGLLLSFTHARKNCPASLGSSPLYGLWLEILQLFFIPRSITWGAYDHSQYSVYIAAATRVTAIFGFHHM
ncbi:hypothetical protein C8Q78DRAFT_249165 [Trametes maxima]|nr:hypothetical protein C8Q78DRAFT_249165 [Trametes maxima]